MALFDALDRNDPAYAYELDSHEAAQIVLDLDPQYHTVSIDDETRERFAHTPAGRAWLKTITDSIQLTGRAADGEPLAHFHFHLYHIVIHCHSGITAEELDQYIVALCAATGLAAVDPQESVVWRIQEDGALA